MSTKSILLNRQKAWAAQRGLKVDTHGYVTDLQQNLFRPLSANADEAFRRGSGSELGPRSHGSPKMHALHSSAALAVNVFDHWTRVAPAPIIGALGLEGRVARVEFESQFPTGLGGTPPNLDIAFWFENGSFVAIESKFSEWLSRKPDGKAPFSASYFASAPGYWAGLGMPRCESLARAMSTGTERFRHLDAAQLLKHMLGLARCAAAQGHVPVTLYYLYFDVDGPEAEIHRQEIAAFQARVGREFDFRWATYQEVLGRLAHDHRHEQAAYVDYLSDRYLAA